MAETVSEITRLAATSEARDIAPRWLNERPEVVRVSFSNYPQELRVIKPSKTKLSNGNTAVTFTEPIEGDGDFNPMHGDAKVMPYGDPIDCDDNILEPIPKNSSKKSLGASQRVKFKQEQMLNASV